VQWNLLLPPTAIASVNLTPGSNPLFGLNTLGGALSIQTKDGFAHPGQRLAFSAGSFGRVWTDVESAAARANVSYYFSGRALRESGWRDFSPSKMGQLFGNVGWRNGRSASIDVSVTAGRTRLRGNGPLPVQLLDRDRRAVFTHPDITEIDHLAVAARASRTLARDVMLNAVAFYRPATFSTLNGDDTDYEPCEDGSGRLCIDDDPVRDQRGQFVAAPASPYDATNNTTRTRTSGYGATAQLTTTRPLLQRENHLIAGMSVDGGRATFTSATELARLTQTRGTTGVGILDAESLVALKTNVVHLGGYLADYLTVAPRMTVSGSVRFTTSDLGLRDQIGTELTGDHHFSSLNPAAGIAIAITPSLTAFGGYSVSSRVPTPSELGCADPDDPCRLPNAFVSDPPLEQVRAHTVEAGLRSRRRSAWAATVFRTVNRDDLLFISSGALTNEGYFANIGDTVRAGLELSVAGRTDAVHWAAAYTVLSATFATPFVVSSHNHPDAVAGEITVPRGARIPSLPRHTLKLDADWSLGRVLAGLSTQYASSQLLRGDEGNLLPPLDGYVVTAMRARFALSHRATIVGQVSNLLNSSHATFGLLGEADDVLGEEYDDPRFLTPAAPRSAWIGLELTLR
jgi:outer membrane receptor for Fe3+-dicitrate